MGTTDLYTAPQTPKTPPTMLGLSARSLSNSTRLAARSSTAVRYASSKGVIETLAEVIPERQEIAKKLRAEHGDKGLGEIKVENVFGGMRGLKVMLWEPSVLDANEGIRFWGKTIPECQEALPKVPRGTHRLFPQVPPPDDPVRHGHRRPQPRLQVRRRLLRRHEKVRVLEVHRRGRPRPLRKGLPHRRPDLPQQVHGRRQERACPRQVQGSLVELCQPDRHV